MNRLEKLLIEREIARNQEDKKYFDDLIAFERKDPNHVFLSKNTWFELAGEIMSSNKKVSENKVLTFEQEKIFNLLLEGKSLAISAKTSFGKTWMIRELFFQKVRKIEESKIAYLNGTKIDLNINFVHVVPNDVLVSDISSKLKSDLSKLNLESHVNIGFPIDLKKSNYIVGTPERIYSEIKNMENISCIIADEAHEMFFDNERSAFYKITTEKLAQKIAEAQVVLCGAFLGRFENSFNRNFVILNPVGFKSLYAIKGEKNLILRDELVDDAEINSGTELQYFSTVNSCIEAFENEVWRSKNDAFEIIKRELGLVKNISAKAKIFDLMSKYKIDSENGDFSKRYNVIDGLIVGVGLYHANMPREMKMLVYQFASEGLLTKIYSTSAITGGLDLNIGKVTFNSLKIRNSDMDMETFFNICGRVGRYRANTQAKLGIVDLKLTKNFENRSWFEKNKSNIVSRKAANRSSMFEDNNDYNVKTTLEELKKWPNDSIEAKALLIDPRIHPALTIKLIHSREFVYDTLLQISKFFEIVFKEDGSIDFEKKLSETGDFIWVWKREQEAKTMLKPFLDLYTHEDYKFKSRAKLHEFKKRDLKIIRYFFKYLITKNENKLFRDYAVFLSRPDVELDYSKAMNELSELFYHEIKYALFSYMNHFFKISNLLDIHDFNLDQIVSMIDANEQKM